MTADLVTHHLQDALVLVMILSLPVLGVAALVGLVVGLLQAVTQIQDQTLPQSIKLVAVLVTLVLTGAWMAGPLVEQARQVFDAFPAIGR